MPSTPEKQKADVPRINHPTCQNFWRQNFETDIFSSMFGRTDPRIGASKAKNCEEVDFEVRKPPNPPKLAKERKNWRPRPKTFVDEKFCSPKIELTGIVWNSQNSGI